MSDYENLSYPQLKSLAKERTGSGKGKRDELVARLQALDALTDIQEDAEAVVKEIHVEEAVQVAAEVSPDVPRETPQPAKVERVDKSTDPDPNHPGYPNWDMLGRWIRRK